VHLHLPHLPAPLLMLSFVYATAIAVALANPGRPTLGALVVLAGLTARWAAHRRRSQRSAGVAVLTPDTAPAPAAAT
jgi:hypothetical protein